LVHEDFVFDEEVFDSVLVHDAETEQQDIADLALALYDLRRRLELLDLSVFVLCALLVVLSHRDWVVLRAVISSKEATFGRGKVVLAGLMSAGVVQTQDLLQGMDDRVDFLEVFDDAKLHHFPE
jgi:hypothetical protein